MAGGLRSRLALAVLFCAGWPLLAASQSVSLTDMTAPELVQVQGGTAPAPSNAPIPGASADGSGVGIVTGVLVLDVDQAYAASAWGRRAQADIEAAAREIEAENTRLEEQLTAEEQALTAERGVLPAPDFRAKAEAFDIRAQTIRRERRQAAVDLGNRAQADRSAFAEAMMPVIAAIMQERNAGVVLDRRQTWGASNAVDITEDLVARIDETFGDGGSLPDAPSQSGSAPDDITAPENVAPPAE